MGNRIGANAPGRQPGTGRIGPNAANRDQEGPLDGDADDAPGAERDNLEPR